MQKLDPEIKYNFTKSRGSGGQNVNKVSTRAELRFNVKNSALLSEEEKQRILENLSSRINKNGELLMSSDRSRSQLQNKTLVTDRFYRLIEQALRTDPDRIATKPTRVSREKRLKTKKIISEKKSSRKKPEI